MKYKFTFKKIKKTDILLVDKNYAGLKFENIKCEIFNYNKLYIKVLIQSLYLFLFKNKSKEKLKDIYLGLFLKIVNAKIIIGSHAEDLIYRAKNYSPKSKILVYLHTRLMNWEIHDLQKVLEKYQVDYVFAIDEIHKKILQKNVKSEFILSGQIKNNEIFIKNKKKIYDIVYVSEFRNVNYPEKKLHFKFIKYIARVLNEYSLNNPEKKMVIAPNCNRRDKKISREEETYFFQKLCPNIKLSDQNDSYEICNSSKLLVCLNSNLGADFLSRGHKVLFLPFMHLYGDKYTNVYLPIDREIFFVNRKFNKKIIFDKINYLFNLDELIWKKELNKSKARIFLDKNNTILKKKIEEIIINEL
jgi:surface carbohydrate biosynthesis protein